MQSRWRILTGDVHKAHVKWWWWWWNKLDDVWKRNDEFTVDEVC